MSKYIPRIFVDQPLAAGATVSLAEAQAHYLGRVMRLNVADGLKVFNGRDGEWNASVSDINKKSSTLSIISQLHPQIKEPDLWLCFAPIKNAGTDFIAEKATELGVSGLQPVITQHTIVTRVNEERMLANAIEAAEQCERLTVPVVCPAKKLMELLATWPVERTLLFCDESGGGKPILQVAASAKAGHPYAILIGPEGGFSKEEIAHLHTLPYVTPVSLGTRILRADTAALAAISCWQAGTL